MPPKAKNKGKATREEPLEFDDRGQQGQPIYVTRTQLQRRLFQLGRRPTVRLEDEVVQEQEQEQEEEEQEEVEQEQVEEEEQRQSPSTPHASSVASTCEYMKVKIFFVM